MNNLLEVKSGTRFFALDAIRGLAALAVVFYHYTQHNGLDWLHDAWVAVDIFFILSGFVLMHSYSKKVAQGMTFNEFVCSRIARLGPMYLVGLAIGISAATYSLLSNPSSPIQPSSMTLAASLNLLLLPYFNKDAWPFGEHLIHGTVFPLNDPSWSLFFEAFVNVLFFFYLYRFQKIKLWLAVVIAGVIFVACTLVFHQVNPGARGDSFVFGFPRVIFEFFLGVLIYKCYGLYKGPSATVAFTIALVAAAGCFSNLGAIGLANGLLIAPVLIAAFAKFEVASWGVGMCKYLGDISYPLYVTHYPLYRLLYEVDFMKGLAPAQQTCVFVLTAVVLASVLVRVDAVVRTALKNRAAGTFA